MGLFSRLFGRKPVVVDRRNMNEDWRVGDLAVCVNDQWLPVPDGAITPKEGDVNRIVRITDSVGYHRTRCFFLWFCDAHGWESVMFRKAIEDATPAEAEFTALIKRPVRAPSRKPVKAPLGPVGHSIDGFGEGNDFHDVTNSRGGQSDNV